MSDSPKMAPVQGYILGIPWEMHLRAYDAYCEKYGSQQALIEGGCRGGFHRSELDMFIPGWREELSQLTRLTTERDALAGELTIAKKRIVWLESLQEKTADGKIIAECEDIYCPKCKRPVRKEFDICYCDECVNEDGGDWPYQPPLPLSYGLCLSSSALKAEASR